MNDSNIRTPRWTRAAYSSWPTLLDGDTDKAVARAAIECWRGTPEELSEAIRVLIDSFPSGTVEITLVFASGEIAKFDTLGNMLSRLTGTTGRDLLLAKAVVASVGGTPSAELIARQKIPGISVTAIDGNGSQMLGVVELVYRKLMAGYVDRMGGLRGLIWMLMANTPILIISFLFSETVAFERWRLPILLGAIAIGFTIFFVSRSFLLVQVPFALMKTVPQRRKTTWRARVRAIYSHALTRPILGGIAAIVLGIVGNKLSDVITFPW